MNLIRLDSVDSTQDEAFRQAATGAPDRTVIVAERQTGGRGRLGREWISLSGNLHLSILLRETACDTAVIPLLTGLALTDLLDADALIKWPNDIMVSGRKMGESVVPGVSSTNFSPIKPRVSTNDLLFSRS